jgi:hypothetical protein
MLSRPFAAFRRRGGATKQPGSVNHALTREIARFGDRRHLMLWIWAGGESLPLRQRHKKLNKINRSLIAIGFSPPDWYTRVVHIDPFDDASLEAS